MRSGWFGGRVLRRTFLRWAGWFLGGGWCAGGGTGEGWSCCWPWLRDRAAWGLPCGGARGSTWVFGAYERGSACLEGSRSGVIVPVCEERGERIMPGRGAAAPGMSAGSIVAGGVISAGGAGRGAVKWGCFAGNVEWADRRGGCCAGHFCAGRDDLGAGDASGLCWEWGAADRRAVFGGGHWPRGAGDRSPEKSLRFDIVIIPRPRKKMPKGGVEKFLCEFEKMGCFFAEHML